MSEAAANYQINLPPSVPPPFLVKLPMRRDASRKKDRKAKQTARNSILDEISICTKLKNNLHLFEHSFISNTFAPGARTKPSSPIEVDPFCEHSDMLDRESAVEHFMIAMTNQLTMGRSGQIPFFVEDVPLVAIIFPRQKCLNVLTFFQQLKQLFKLLQANVRSADRIYLII